MPSNSASSPSCWALPGKPTPELLAALKAGPFTGKTGPALDALLAELRREKVAKPVIFVGAGTCGLGAGAAKTLARIKALLTERALDADVREVGCIGLCSEEPIVDIQLPGRTRVSFSNVTDDKVDGLFDAVLQGRLPAENVLGQFYQDGLEPWWGPKAMHELPFLSIQKRWVLANSGLIDFTSIDEYIARGGYSAVYKALTTMTRQEVVDQVLTSGLRGRGGAGFPTGKKWQMALNAAGDQKYMVCNADEGDPGAFMDRAVCESDPHRLLEGMITGCYAIGATKAYIYIRAEYPLAIQNLKIAMKQAREYGLLGENILGSGFDLDIVIKMGAGAFVCGEETALMGSIEGKRGMPRPRPPYPIQSGIFGKPTVINNVLSFASTPWILAHGGKAYAEYGVGRSRGSQPFQLAGNIKRGGLVELAFGATIRRLVEDFGGGTRSGRPIRAVQVGGPLGAYFPLELIDTPLDYEAMLAAKGMLGHGGIVVFDDSVDMARQARFAFSFCAAESCGKCTPCRIGSTRGAETVDKIVAGRDRPQNIQLLRDLCEVLTDGSLCALGGLTPLPVLSALDHFGEDFADDPARAAAE